MSVHYKYHLVLLGEGAIVFDDSANDSEREVKLVREERQVTTLEDHVTIEEDKTDSDDDHVTSEEDHVTTEEVSVSVTISTQTEVIDGPIDQSECIED